MTIIEAKRLVPDLIIVQPDFDLFRQYSRHLLRIAYAFTPIIEPVSIDEFYMDMTGALHGTPVMQAAETLQQTIFTKVMDVIRDKYGEAAIFKAAAKQSPGMELLRHKERGYLTGQRVR